MATNNSSDKLHPDLMITRENRSQYLETAIASVSAADRLIRQAEALGRQRREREIEAKERFNRIAWVLLLLLPVAIVVGLVIFLPR